MLLLLSPSRSLSLFRGRGPVAALAFGSLILGVAEPAEARGQLRIVADSALVNLAATPTDTSFDVAGALRDDAGEPITGATVTLSVAQQNPPSASACPHGNAVQTTSNGVMTETDALGLFCMRVPKASVLADAVLRYDGDGFHAATAHAVPEPSGHRTIELAFEDRQLYASLDEPSVAVRVTTHVADNLPGGDPLRLVLFHRPDAASNVEVEVSATDVAPGGAAKFDVESRTLGAPGIGKLVVRFAGTVAFSPAEQWALFERRATVRLSLAAALSPSDPTEGVELPVAVGSATGAVPGGFVEAMADGHSVGLGPVSAGAARVIATFAPPRGRPAEVTLRYVPSAAGYLAGDAVTVAIPLRPPNPWSGIAWLAAAIAIAYSVVRAWRRPAQRARPATRTTERALGRPAVELLERDATRSGWRGRVQDAHDGTPIGNARIRLIVPVFDGEGVAATHTTLADGAFVIPHVAAAKNEGARLIVGAPHHSALEKPMPPDGTLIISLVSRRRALLDRLVAWTRRTGRPFSRKQEPTPSEVVAAARGVRRGDVLDWARATEHAAYGPVAPDERREAEITEMEPSESPVDAPRDER